MDDVTKSQRRILVPKQFKLPAECTSDTPYKALKNVGYCESDTAELEFYTLKTPAECWNKCQERKYNYAEWLDNICYCQKDCPCMGDISNKDRITLFLKEVTVPEACCKDLTLAFQNKANRNCKWVAKNNKCNKKWKNKSIKNHWCPVSCETCD